MLKLWKSAAAAALATLLISCGGGGGGGGGGGIGLLPPSTSGNGTQTPATPQPEPTAPAAYTTFALLPYKSVVVSFSKSNPAPGETVGIRTINALKNAGGSSRDMAYDAKRDRLYISAGSRILMIPKASQASGDVTPAQYDVLSSGLSTYSTMVLDAERDELWLGGPMSRLQGALVKISNISAAYGQIRTLEAIRPEETRPVASYQVWYIRSSMLMRFAIDPVRSLVYTSDIIGGVFDLATLTPARKETSGNPVYEESVAYNNAPVRMLFNGTNMYATDIALDAARNRLYVLGSDGREVITVDGASTANTPSTFSRLPLPTVNSSIAIDAKNDRLYIGGVDNNAYIFNNASTITAGTTVPGTSVLGAPESVAGKGVVWGISFP